MLFSYLEYIGFDYENDMEDRGEAKPGNTGMWKACIPCQIPVETRKEGEWWASIKEVFYLR